MGGSYCWVHAWNCHGNAEISWHFIQCVGSKDSCTHGPLSFRSSYPTKAAAVFSFRTAPTGRAVAICETGACRQRGAVLQLSAEILLHFFHVKPPGRKSGGKKKQTQTMLVCPFASVLKELNAPNTEGLALGEVGAGPCPAGCDRLCSPCVAEQGCS